jgi:hypothetical protein
MAVTKKTSKERYFKELVERFLEKGFGNIGYFWRGYHRTWRNCYH